MQEYFPDSEVQSVAAQSSSVPSEPGGLASEASRSAASTLVDIGVGASAVVTDHAL